MPVGQQSCQHDEYTLSEDASASVEGVAESDKEGLVLAAQGQHVVPVGGFVVGGAGKGHQCEAGHGGLHKEGRWQRECDAGEGGSKESLHGQYPEALGTYQIDEGAPQWLDYPRCTEPAGVESDFLVAEFHVLVHDEGQGHDGEVGKSCGKV